MICTADQIYVGVQMREVEMGWACGICGGEEKCMQGFGGETAKKGTTWKT